MGWIVAIILAALLISSRKKLKALRQHSSGGSDDRTVPTTGAAAVKPEPGLQASRDLVILRLQLSRMREADALPEELYRKIVGQIDACWAEGDQHTQPQPGSDAWWQSCDAGWYTLIGRGLMPYGPPPWSGQVQAARPPPPPSPVPTVPSPGASDRVTAAPPVVEKAQAPREAAAGPEPVAARAQPAARRRKAELAEAGRSTLTRAPRLAMAGAARAAAAWARAWHPTPPDALERALRAVAGWPRLLVPFLLQNIGWFIGGFLILAGSVFLVSYTAGFLQAAVVFVSLYAYTVFLIWAGYKLLQTHPRLTMASSVLLVTGMLLIPLTIAAATRLVLSAGDSVWFWIMGVLGALLCVGTFYFAAQVVSGVTHRSLQGAYSRLFIALAALQLAAVLLVGWPSWPALGALHLLLLGLLAYGLLRFTHEWLHSIFVDRKKIAYFAAGSLLYAALASFVHLTWGTESAPLPPGYYAPYLMIICALLFYLDAQFKLHVHRVAFLSRFSFLVYGLSVLSVVLAIDAPVARLITLALAAALYAIVLWKYLTLIPLYLMLASVCGLYAFALLTYFPTRTHLLLALPGLYGLSALSRWAARRSAQKPATNPQGLTRVALVTYRATLLLLTLLATWSLVNSYGQPGLLAAGTGLAFATALAWLLRAAPGPILTAADTSADFGRPVNLLRGPWLYALIVALTASVAYAPVMHSSWAPQFSILLVMLGCLWTALLLYRRRRGGRGETAQFEVYANSTLLNLTVSIALAAALTVQQTLPSVLLVGVLWLSAAILLTLSLNLYVRWLFYAFLIVAAAAVAVTKLTYFPQPSVGLIEMLGVGALWALLWWLDRQPDELSEIARRRAWRDAPARLLWLLPGAKPEIEPASLAEPIGEARASEAPAAAPAISDR